MVFSLVQGPNHSGCPSVLSWAISRELNRKWNSQDSNWCPDRMPAAGEGVVYIEFFSRCCSLQEYFFAIESLCSVQYSNMIFAKFHA